MKNLMFLFVTLFLIGAGSLAAQSADDKQRDRAVDARKDAQQASEKISELCDQDPKDAAAIRSALEKARSAKATAREAADAVSKGSPFKDNANEAAEEAKEAYENAGSTAGGMQIEYWLKAYAEKVRKEIADNDELCPGERGTATNVLDDLTAEVTRLAELYPCDSTTVRDSLEAYLSRRHENGCDKLKAFIEDYFAVYHEDGEDQFFLPKEALISLTFSGRTTGVIGILTVTNPTRETMHFTIPPFSTPSIKGDQRQITDGPINITVGPGQTVTEEVTGYCVHVNRPAPDANRTISLSRVTFRPKTPVNGIAGQPGWTGTSDSDLIDPATGALLSAVIDFDQYPNQTWFLFEALDRIQAEYQQLLAEGTINPAFGNTPEEKLRNYVQQALWEVAATAMGFEYGFAAFLENGITQIEETYNIDFSDLSREEQEAAREPFVVAWSEITLVGGAMKVESQNPGGEPQTISIDNNECECGVVKLNAEVFLIKAGGARTSQGSFQFNSGDPNGIKHTIGSTVSPGDQLEVIVKDVKPSCTPCKSGDCFPSNLSVFAEVDADALSYDEDSENLGAEAVYHFPKATVKDFLDTNNHVVPARFYVKVRYHCDSSASCDSKYCTKTTFLIQANRAR